MELKVIAVDEEAEQAFIDGCIKAILANDTSNTHMLILNHGQQVYLTIIEGFFDGSSLLHKPQGKLQYLCIFSEKLILHLHQKAIEDPEPTKCALLGVQQILKYGKEIASELYGKKFV